MKIIHSIVLLGLLSCFLGGCSSPTGELKTSIQEIRGRGFANKRPPIYRAKVPDSWVRRDPLPSEDLSDTTKAICEFIIKQNDELIRIAVHSFPTETFEERIPADAQVARWKRQFTSLAPNDYVMTPFNGNGYLGIFFKGHGSHEKGGEEKKSIMVLGFSLLIAPEHYRTLAYAENIEILEKQKEMRADITIKAVGRPKAFIANEEDIIRFARSFELIDEIPMRS